MFFCQNTHLIVAIMCFHANVLRYGWVANWKNLAMIGSMTILLPPERVDVSHPTGSYPILLGDSLHMKRLKVDEIVPIEGQFVVVTDENVAPLWSSIEGATAVIKIPAGEQHKNLETVRHVYDELFKLRLDRKSTLVAVGGGVVGDLTGFVAATYMRGIDFVQCPTTLLSMVDASVGGKTGVDMPQGKNLVGAFKQPTAVFINIHALQTLPPVELASGMAEVIKHGLISDPNLFATFEQPDWHIANKMDDAAWQKLVARAIQVKIGVVEDDPFEWGRRATLNLGHTFGHAIEHVTQFGVRHGEGVAMGMVAAANLSARLGYCDPALQPRIEAVLHKANLPTRIPANLDPEEIYAAMFTDKKAAAGKVRFILIRDVGDVFLDGDVADTAVLTTLQELQE